LSFAKVLSLPSGRDAGSKEKEISFRDASLPSENPSFRDPFFLCPSEIPFSFRDPFFLSFRDPFFLQRSLFPSEIPFSFQGCISSFRDPASFPEGRDAGSLFWFLQRDAGSLSQIHSRK